MMCCGLSRVRNDGSCVQTEMGDFRKFKKTNITFNYQGGLPSQVYCPCIEQRTIDELLSMISGTYKMPKAEGLIQVGLDLVHQYKLISQIGGAHRASKIVQGLSAILDVAKFMQLDIDELCREIFSAGIRL